MKRPAKPRKPREIRRKAFTVAIYQDEGEWLPYVSLGGYTSTTLSVPDAEQIAYRLLAFSAWAKAKGKR